MSKMHPKSQRERLITHGGFVDGTVTWGAGL